MDKLKFVADGGTELRVMVSEAAYKTVKDIAKETGLSTKAVATKTRRKHERNQSTHTASAKCKSGSRHLLQQIGDWQC